MTKRGIKKRTIKRVVATAVTTLLATLGIGAGIFVYEDANKDNIVPKTEGNIANENETGELQIHYISIDQGDATLIVCDGHAMLVDAGENNKGLEVVDYLKSQKIEKLDYMIGTHPDSDHIGGMDVVIKNIDCDNVFMPAYKKDNKTYDDVIKTAKKKNYKIQNPKVSEVYKLGGAEFTIIAPNKKYDDSNNSSIGFILKYKDKKFLFTGDAEHEAEKDIIKNKIDIRADVYKAGHHGSRTASGEDFLAKVKPDYIVVSCGENNEYGHPHAAIVNYCITNHIPMYRTDMQGTIVLKTDGKDITWNMSPYEFQ